MDWYTDFGKAGLSKVLTTNYADSSCTFEVDKMKVVTLNVGWTTGWAAAATPSSLRIRISGAPDASTFFQESTVSTSSYTTTVRGGIYTLAPDDGDGSAVTPTTSTIYRRCFKVDVEAYKTLKVEVREVLGTGGTPAAGSIVLTASLIS